MIKRIKTVRNILTGLSETASRITLVIIGLAVMLSPFLRFLRTEKLSVTSHHAPQEISELGELRMSLSPTISLTPVGENPGVSGMAKGAVLMDAHTGEVLYRENENLRLPMASTTKIMTALVASEMSDPDTVVKIPPEACGIEGSSIYLMPGEQVSMETLLYGLLLESGNDAATAIAIACAGSVESFVQCMNRKAQEMGLENTHFTNPHGLFNEEHYTTAYELALITAVAMENKSLAHIMSSKNAVCGRNTDTTGGKLRYFTNHNKLLSMYDGVIGGKTGFTTASGRCLASCAMRGDTKLVAVTLGCPDDWNVHTSLYNYGFSGFKSIALTSADGIDLSPFGIHAPCGKDNPLYFTLPVNDSKVHFRCTVEYADGVCKLSAQRQ